MPIVQAPPVHPEIVARQVTQAGDICVVLHNHIYNMHMDYDFDPTKSAANLKKHGVDFDEAATCLLDEMARVREDSDVSGEQPRAKDVPHLTALRTKSKAASKTRISILVDAEVIAAFRARAEAQGRGYQTLMNDALRAALDPDAAPVTISTLRALLDERLSRANE